MSRCSRCHDRLHGRDLDELVRRAAPPESLDIFFGSPDRVRAGGDTPHDRLGAARDLHRFLLFPFFGGLILDWLQIGHKGYGIDRIVGQSYMGLEGIFGVPLDVAATYIVLFAIYGAVLEFSGAARFFMKISFAAFGRGAPARAAPARSRASCSAR